MTIKLRAAFAAAVIALGLAGATGAATTAQAHDWEWRRHEQWREWQRERAWREREWARERAWRERAWREREWRERRYEGYYQPRAYYPPPRSYWR
jgi:hypothetical protein